jgi:hypothetical protein
MVGSIIFFWPYYIRVSTNRELTQTMNRLASRQAAYAPRQQPESGVHTKVPTSPGSGGHLKISATSSLV